MRVAAITLRCNQCALGDKHRRRCSQIDSLRAVKGTAHELTRNIYAMETKGVEYMGMDREAKAAQTRQRRMKRLQSEVRKFGLNRVKFINPEITTPAKSVA